jgi:hypothetical protein
VIRIQTLIIASGVALACALPLSSAEAGGIKPGFHARMQLKNGSGWSLYDAGCLKWNFQQHSWYTTACEPHPVVAKY